MKPDVQHLHTWRRLSGRCRRALGFARVALVQIGQPGQGFSTALGLANPGLARAFSGYRQSTTNFRRRAPGGAPKRVRQAIERSFATGPRPLVICRRHIHRASSTRCLPPLTLHRRVAGARHTGLGYLRGWRRRAGLGVGVVLAIEVELLLELGGGIPRRQACSSPVRTGR